MNLRAAGGVDSRNALEVAGTTLALADSLSLEVTGSLSFPGVADKN